MALTAEFKSLPANGGAPITSIEFSVNGGSAQAFAGILLNTPYTITGADLGDEIRIRAVNSVGAGEWSAVKSLSEANAEILLNNSFTDGTVWAGTDATTDFTITGGNLVIADRGPDFTHGVYQDVTLLANTTYTLSVTFSAASPGIRIKMEDESAFQTDVAGLTPLSTPGTYTANFTTTADTAWRFIISTTGEGGTATVNEVSLKLAA